MAEDLVDEATKGIVKVLRAGGEVRLEGNKYHAPATITVIKIYDPFYKTTLPTFTGIIDTGGDGEAEKVQELLIAQRVFPGRVCEVYLTHNHPDHIGNNFLFNNARKVGADSIYHPGSPNEYELLPDEFMRKPGVEIQGGIPGFSEMAKVISTPGHSGQDLSVLYKGGEGLIAIVGDLFWSQEDWEHDSEFMGLCVSPELQRLSRDYVRGKVKPEVVVPGHGPAFAPKY